MSVGRQIGRKLMKTVHNGDAPRHLLQPSAAHAVGVRVSSNFLWLVAVGQSGAALSPGTTSWRTWRQSGLESSRGGATPQRPLSDSQTVCTDKQTPQTDRRTPRHTLRVMPDSPVAPGGMNMTETRATAAIMTILTDPSQ